MPVLGGCLRACRCRASVPPPPSQHTPRTTQQAALCTRPRYASRAAGETHTCSTPSHSSTSATCPPRSQPANAPHQASVRGRSRSLRASPKTCWNKGASTKRRRADNPTHETATETGTRAQGARGAMLCARAAARRERETTAAPAEIATDRRLTPPSQGHAAPAADRPRPASSSSFPSSCQLRGEPGNQRQGCAATCASRGESATVPLGGHHGQSRHRSHGKGRRGRPPEPPKRAASLPVRRATSRRRAKPAPHRAHQPRTTQKQHRGAGRTGAAGARLQRCGTARTTTGAHEHKHPPPATPDPGLLTGARRATQPWAEQACGAAY